MLLQVQHLKKYFGTVRAVDDVTFGIDENEVLGLVGESGCGKSTVGRCLLRLLEPTEGTIHFRDTDLLALPQKAMREMRQHLQIVFQDPLSSLNPRMTVRDIVGEPLVVHNIARGKALQERVVALLEDVGLNGSHLVRYPHEFSGGQRQRIGIARALALNPQLIVADEPVSALDVSVQAQIINLMVELKERHKLSYLFIAHNLAVVKHISDRIAVMYLGRIVESGPANLVCDAPLHPYTKALLSAVPEADPLKARQAATRILVAGDVPSPSNPPSGCAFHPRCPLAVSACRKDVPDMVAKGQERFVRCSRV